MSGKICGWYLSTPGAWVFPNDILLSIQKNTIVISIILWGITHILSPLSTIARIVDLIRTPTTVLYTTTTVSEFFEWVLIATRNLYAKFCFTEGGIWFIFVMFYKNWFLFLWFEGGASHPSWYATASFLGRFTKKLWFLGLQGEF